MLVHQPDVALAIIDMLLGNEPGATRDLNEMEQSALGEMGNIIGSAFLNAIADALSLRLQPSPPEVILDMAGAILDVAFAEILQQSDDVIVAETSFGTADRQARGTFLVIPSFNFLKVILSHAGVEK
jgi:chemotaxis protein CheC